MRAGRVTTTRTLSITDPLVVETALSQVAPVVLGVTTPDAPEAGDTGVTLAMLVSRTVQNAAGAPDSAPRESRVLVLNVRVRFS